MKIAQLILIFVSLIVPISCFAQSDSNAVKRQAIIIGQKHTIQSSVFAQERELLIAPVDLERSYSGNYVPVYVLDGEQMFTTALAALKTLSQLQAIPPILLVGIPNPPEKRLFELTDRGTGRVPEYLHSQLGKSIPKQAIGGAEKLLEFVETEVSHYIKQDYVISDHKVWVGHSLASVLLLQKLQALPASKNSYVFVSPTLWWENKDKKTLLDQFKDLSKLNNNASKIYLSMGSVEGRDLDNRKMTLDYLEQFTELEHFLDTEIQNSRWWKTEVLDGESHMTSPHSGLLRGFRFTFSEQ